MASKIPVFSIVPLNHGDVFVFFGTVLRNSSCLVGTVIVEKNDFTINTVFL